MIGHRHMQLYLGMMEKREKLLAIYDAIPPRVWEELDFQLLFDTPKFQKKMYGKCNYNSFTVILCG